MRQQRVAAGKDDWASSMLSIDRGMQQAAGQWLQVVRQ